MCLKTTLKKMLEISTKLTDISLEKLNLIGAKFANEKFPTFSAEGTEEDYTSYISHSKKENDNILITTTFLLITELLTTKADDTHELSIILKNAESYTEILTDLVANFPRYQKQSIDNEISTEYQKAISTLEELQARELSRKLIVCKRAIFE